jgi:hypothetical protein
VSELNGDICVRDAEFEQMRGAEVAQLVKLHLRTISHYTDRAPIVKVAAL